MIHRERDAHTQKHTHSVRDARKTESITKKRQTNKKVTGVALKQTGSQSNIQRD
jgi:hypothetical protein